MCKVYAAALVPVLYVLCSASSATAHHLGNCDHTIIDIIRSTKTLLELSNFENTKWWVAVITEGIVEATTKIDDSCGALYTNGTLPTTICEYKTTEQLEGSQLPTCFEARYYQSEDGVNHGLYLTSELVELIVYTFQGPGNTLIEYRCFPTGALLPHFALTLEYDEPTLSSDDLQAFCDEVHKMSPDERLIELGRP